MSTKYTPAPWKAGSKSVRAEETDERLGLEVRIYGGNGQDNAANARLIAAAPELLEALKDVCQAYAWLTFGECRGWSESEPLTMQEALDKAETLITKAEGKQA